MRKIRIVLVHPVDTCHKDSDLLQSHPTGESLGLGKIILGDVKLGLDSRVSGTELVADNGLVTLLVCLLVIDSVEARHVLKFRSHTSIFSSKTGLLSTISSGGAAAGDRTSLSAAMLLMLGDAGDV